MTDETEPPGVFADLSWSAEAEEWEGRVEFSGCLCLSRGLPGDDPSRVGSRAS